MRSRSAIFPSIALAVAAVLAGCSIDQQQDVAEYRRVLDAAMPIPDEVPDPDEPLSLDRALQIANQLEERLGSSGEDYVQALINRNRAVAAFLPTVSFQPTYTIADRPPNFTPSSPSGVAGTFVARGDTVQQAEAPVVGNLNVFRGFGDVADLHAAEAIIAERRELLLDLQATVMLNVAQTYYQVLRSEASVKVLRQNLEVEQARLLDVEQQLLNGLATKLTVAQTRAQVDSTRVSLVQAESDVRNGRHTLALVIGLQAVPNPLVDDLPVPAELTPEAEYEVMAIAHRQDLLAAGQALDAARHNVDAAIAQYYPSVSLNVAGFLYREQFSDASKWAAILSANLPIFSAGLIEADVRTAWSQVRQAALNETSVRRNVRHDVQVSYENLTTSESRIVDLRDEVEAADEAYRQAEGAFQNGLGINLDVLIAQEQLLDAQLQLTGALYDRSVFFLDLVRSTGQLTYGLGTILPVASEVRALPQ